MFNKPIKCGYCGKFIAHKKLKKVKYIFTPDSSFSTEESCLICEKCNKKN